MTGWEFVGLSIYRERDLRLRVSGATLSSRLGISLEKKIQHPRDYFYGTIEKTPNGEPLLTLADACGLLWNHRHCSQSLFAHFSEELELAYTTTNMSDLSTCRHQHTNNTVTSIANAFATRPTDRLALIHTLQHQHRTLNSLTPISQLHHRQVYTRLDVFKDFAVDIFGGNTPAKTEEMVVGLRLFLERESGLYSRLLTQSNVLVKRAKQPVINALQSAVESEIAYANAAAKIVLKLSSRDLAWLRKVFKRVTRLIGFDIVLNYKYVVNIKKVSDHLHRHIDVATLNLP